MFRNFCNLPKLPQAYPNYPNLPELPQENDVHFSLPRERYRVFSTISFTTKVAMKIVRLCVKFQVHEIIIVAFK